MKTFTKQEDVEKAFTIATQERVPHTYLSRDPRLPSDASRYEVRLSINDLPGLLADISAASSQQNQIVFLNREFKFKTAGSFVTLEKGTKFMIESDPTTKNVSISMQYKVISADLHILPGAKDDKV
jgi:hypothetical protein